jgi:hypothetical protein
MRRFMPFWAVQFLIGALAVLIGALLVIMLVTNATRLPGQFLEEVGRAVHRILPSESPDIQNDAQLKAVIRAMPDGRLRVASVVAEDDVVVLTITADRSAVQAAVAPGDEIRISRETGEVEIAPQGIPGLFDQLGEEMRRLRERFFGP